MKTLEVYDPAMCCSTGVCGPDVDPALVAFAADLKWAGEQGVTIKRYNLGQEPQAFMANAAVVKEIEAGMDRLPIIAVDGRIVSTGVYLSRSQIAQKLGLNEDVSLFKNLRAVARQIQAAAEETLMALPHIATRYLFFTGKGGVGKTSLACATAVALADRGQAGAARQHRPGVNLDEVLGVRARQTRPRRCRASPDLYAMNIDPEAAARGVPRAHGRPRTAACCPTAAVRQHGGAVLRRLHRRDRGLRRVRPAARRRPATDGDFDHVIFDTAPTGHTLRLLSLPVRLDGFMATNTTRHVLPGPARGPAGPASSSTPRHVASARPTRRRRRSCWWPARGGGAARGRAYQRRTGRTGREEPAPGRSTACSRPRDPDDAIAAAMARRSGVQALWPIPAGCRRPAADDDAARAARAARDRLRCGP